MIANKFKYLSDYIILKHFRIDNYWRTDVKMSKRMR